jgi:Flp pilus assembly protein TadD
VIGAFGFIFLVGNMFLSRSASAAASGRWMTAARYAQRATNWLPWSTEPWRRLGEAQLAEGRARAAQTSFRNAIGKDSRDWYLWFDLARSSSGARQAKALARAAALNPRSPEIAEFESELEGGGISITAGQSP